MSWDFSFATADLPGRDRFEAWQDVSRRLVGVEAQSEAPEDFDGAFAGCGLGPVTFVRSTSRSSWYERTREQADRSDEISLSFLGGPHHVARACSEDQHLPAGGVTFLTHDRPFTLTQEDVEDTSFHFVIERPALSDLLPSGGPIGIRIAPGDHGMLSLIRGYIPAVSMAAESGNLSDDTRAMFGRHIVDLVAALLRPAADALEVIEQRGLKAARIKAILDLIARDHARRDLSPASIGQQLGISPRQVHRLLEETPKTFNEHLIEARLSEAFALLSDPFGPALPVAEIARRCGFGGISHFSRSFAVRFGDSPTTVRAKAARDAAAAASLTDRVIAS